MKKKELNNNERIEIIAIYLHYVDDNNNYYFIISCTYHSPNV